MTREELQTGVTRLAADLLSIGEAIDRMMAAGTERLIPDHERHANLGTLRQGIGEMHADVQQLAAGLLSPAGSSPAAEAAPDVDAPKPKRPKRAKKSKKR
jgi:hypothetical protein